MLDLAARARAPRRVSLRLFRVDCEVYRKPGGVFVLAPPRRCRDRVAARYRARTAKRCNPERLRSLRVGYDAGWRGDAGAELAQELRRSTTSVCASLSWQRTIKALFMPLCMPITLRSFCTACRRSSRGSDMAEMRAGDAAPLIATSCAHRKPIEVPESIPYSRFGAVFHAAPVIGLRIALPKRVSFQSDRCERLHTDYGL